MNLGIQIAMNKPVELQMRGILEFAFRLLRQTVEMTGGLGALQPIEAFQPIEIDSTVARASGLTIKSTRADRMYARALYRDLVPARLPRARTGTTRF